MSATEDEVGWEVLTMEAWQERTPGEEEQCWELPEWLEPYRHLIGDTGDQSVEAVMNGWKADFHDDHMRAARLMAVNAQIELLERLRQEGLLLPEVLADVKGYRA